MTLPPRLPPRNTKAFDVLQRLKEGPMCSQSFFYEDKYRTNITHRCAADVERLKHKYGWDIESRRPCWHKPRRKGACEYILHEPGQEELEFR